MIYFLNTKNILEQFSSEYDEIKLVKLLDKVSMVKKEFQNTLSYLLYSDYIYINGENIGLTDNGKLMFLAFEKHYKKFIKLLEKLEQNFPNNFTRTELAKDMDLLIFKNLYAFLKNKQFVDVSLINNRDIIRLSEKGFILLDIIRSESKIQQLLD